MKIKVKYIIIWIKKDYFIYFQHQNLIIRPSNLIKIQLIKVEVNSNETIDI